MDPEIYVISGPNGAGKSTSAVALLPKWLGVEQFVNADLIAQGLSPFAPQSAAIEAGELMLRRIHELRARAERFAIETTLATHSYAPFLRNAPTAGCVVHIIYLWLESVQLAQSRVAARAARGGHDVPAHVTERRYWRGLRNFLRLYRPLCDTWTLCDNSTSQLSIVALGMRNEVVTIAVEATYNRIRKMADEQG